MLSQVHTLTCAENNDKDPKFKVDDHVILSKYKSVFVKDYTPYWSEQDFFIKKVKATVLWTYAIKYLKLEETWTFLGKKLQKTIQAEFRIEKVIQKKGNKSYVKLKSLITCLIAAYIRKTSLYKMSYYGKADSYGRKKIKVEIDLSNCATKSEVKKATDTDTSDFVKKWVRNCSNHVDNNVVKEARYDETI